VTIRVHKQTDIPVFKHDLHANEQTRTCDKEETNTWVGTSISEVREGDIDIE